MGKNTKGIIELDVKTVIGELNKALADEFLAANQYWIGAQVVKGIYRNDVIKELEEHSQDEYKHAKMISKRIIQLDGTPVLEPKDWYNLTNCGYLAPKDFDSESILKQNLQGERCAIDIYNSLSKKLKNKDEITYLMILEILKDEQEHECDIENLLEDIKLTK